MGRTNLHVQRYFKIIEQYGIDAFSSAYRGVQGGEHTTPQGGKGYLRKEFSLKSSSRVATHNRLSALKPAKDWSFLKS